jgi:hypothetical protein
MAHAIEGGKCKVWEKWPSGQPQAGGSEYLELHGAFSIALRAPGAALLSRFGFLAGRGAREIALVCWLLGAALRAGSRPAEVGCGGLAVRRQGGNLIPSDGILPNLVYLCCDPSTDSNVDCARPDTDIVDIEIPSHDLAPANRSARRCGDLYRA